MLSTKEQIRAVKEYIKMNKPIVDMNAKVAQKYIQENNIKSRKKKTKNLNSNEKSAYDIFMEEATKMILEDAIEYWMEIKSINNEKDINTNLSKITLNEDNNIKNSSLKVEKDNTGEPKSNIENLSIKAKENTKDKSKNNNTESSVKTEKDIKDDTTKDIKVKTTKTKNKKSNSKKSTKSNNIESIDDSNKPNKEQKIRVKDLLKDVKVVEESFQLAFF